MTVLSHFPRRHLLLLGFVLLLAAFPVVACASSDGTSNNGGVKTYTSADYGFSFEYPAGWQLKEGTTAEVSSGSAAKSSVTAYDPKGAVADDTYIDLVLASVYELNMTVDESMLPDIRAEVEGVLGDLESQAPDMQVVEALSDAKVGGIPGFSITYSFDKGGEPTTSTLYFLFNGAVEYQLALQAATKNWEANTPVFKAVVSSFKPGPDETPSR